MHPSHKPSRKPRNILVSTAVGVHNTEQKNFSVLATNAQHPSAFFPWKVKAFCPSILSSHHIKAKHFKKGTWPFEAVREMHTQSDSLGNFYYGYTFSFDLSYIQPGAKLDQQRGSFHSDTLLAVAKSNQPFSKSLFFTHFWINAIQDILGEKQNTAEKMKNKCL